MRFNITTASNRINLVLILSLLFSSHSYACSLIDTPFETYLDRAEHVFIGRLSDGSTDTLTVTKRYKGADVDQVAIKVPKFPTSCDIQLVAGEDYLFFENGDPPFQLTMGTGTRGLNFLPDEWAVALEKLKPQ